MGQPPKLWAAQRIGVVWFTATLCHATIMAAAAWHGGGGENARHGLATIAMRYTTTTSSKRQERKACGRHS